MTDPITDLRDRVDKAGTNLMIDPPLRTEEARALLRAIDALVAPESKLPAQVLEDMQDEALAKLLDSRSRRVTLQITGNQKPSGYVNDQDTRPHVECFGCGAREVLVTGRGDLAGRGMFNMQCTVCGRQWSQAVDYVETETEGDEINYWASHLGQDGIDYMAEHPQGTAGAELVDNTGPGTFTLRAESADPDLSDLIAGSAETPKTNAWRVTYKNDYSKSVESWCYHFETLGDAHDWMLKDHKVRPVHNGKRFVVFEAIGKTTHLRGRFVAVLIDRTPDIKFGVRQFLEADRE